MRLLLVINTCNGAPYLAPFLRYISDLVTVSGKKVSDMSSFVQNFV